jgi:hypothetical protein
VSREPGSTRDRLISRVHYLGCGLIVFGLLLATFDPAEEERGHTQR